MIQQTLIIYNMKAEATVCFDGFCSAMLLWSKYGNTAQYVQAFYHKTLPIERFIGKDVIFANFSYGKEFMDCIASVANSLKVFSSQDTIRRELEDSTYYVTGNKSSCALVWDELLSTGHFQKTKQRPAMLSHLDLFYRNSVVPHETKKYIAALAVIQVDFAVWFDCMEQTAIPGSQIYLEFLHTGHAVLELHTKICENISGDAFDIELLGVKGLAVNANKAFSSDLGHILASQCSTFGAVFYMRPDLSIEFSLRSTSVDVEKIAQFYGGGGHKNASGFSMTYSNFLTLLDPSRRTMELCLKIDALLPLFSSPAFQYHRTEDEVADLISIFMGIHLGHLAEDLQISVDKIIVDKKSALVRFGTYIANKLRLPPRADRRRWYHYILPYMRRQEVRFDDQQIKELLDLAVCDVGGATNSFVADCLMKTVNIQYIATLPRKTALFEVTVGLKDSTLRSQHTFEVQNDY